MRQTVHLVLSIFKPDKETLVKALLVEFMYTEEHRLFVKI